MNSTKNQKTILLNSLHTEEIAYWVGVFQSDGYFKKQYVKSKKRMRYFISLSVSDKSLLMLEKFRRISQKYFKIKGSVYQTYFNHKLNHFRFGCQQILRLLNELDVFYKNPVSPPAWVLQEEYLFGAYLAGLIDGDGDVRISRKKYPQCKVRIHGSKEPKRLVAEIERHLKCGAHSTIRIRVNKLKGRVFKSRGSVTEFAISKKNILFINKYVVPHLTLEYKKDKIMKIKKRAVPGI